MKKEYIKLDSIVTEIELMQERALNLCTDVGQEYFKMEPEDLAFYQNNYRIKNDIVFDYLYQIGKKLEEIREIMSGAQDDKAGYREQIIDNLSRAEIKGLEILNGLTKAFAEEPTGEVTSKDEIISIIAYNAYNSHVSEGCLKWIACSLEGLAGKKV